MEDDRPWSLTIFSKKASHFGKTLHKVHGNVTPNGRRHVERLQQATRVKVLRLVPLADCTPLDEFPH
jgi:hypothetical protein